MVRTSFEAPALIAREPTRSSARCFGGRACQMWLNHWWNTASSDVVGSMARKVAWRSAQAVTAASDLHCVSTTVEKPRFAGA